MLSNMYKEGLLLFGQALFLLTTTGIRPKKCSFYSFDRPKKCSFLLIVRPKKCKNTE